MSFDLESAIGAWRQRYADRRGLRREDLDELEAHLRDDIANRMQRGANPMDAFHAAAEAVGDISEAETEYRKVYWGKLRRQHAFSEEVAVRLAMAQAYFRATLRGLARRKGYSFINIAGLTLGLACCLVIFQFVALEYSFDRFHAHERDLYRVLQTTPLMSESFDGGRGDNTGFALAPALAELVPEVARVARLHPEYDGALVANPARSDLVFEEDHIFYADPAFLEMFSFPLVAGSSRAALEPGTMLLSEQAARKYFGDVNPIGQVLDVTGSTEQSYRVTGIFRDVPLNSHLQFEMLLPMEDLLQTEDYLNEPEGGWSWNNFTTYLQLVPSANVAAVERKMTQAYEARRGDMLREQGRKVRLWAQPLRDVHLNASIQSWDGIVVGSSRTVYFFTVIGLVTLMIALINYVNLATARALERAAEVGVRKAVGARREQLAGQFLFESALVNAVAALLGHRALAPARYLCSTLLVGCALAMGPLARFRVLACLRGDLCGKHATGGALSGLCALVLPPGRSAQRKVRRNRAQPVVDAARPRRGAVRSRGRTHWGHGSRLRPAALHAPPRPGARPGAGAYRRWTARAAGRDRPGASDGDLCTRTRTPPGSGEGRPVLVAARTRLQLERSEFPESIR